MMRIFLAGGSGVIGVRLIPLLVGAGYVVAGMTRSPGKADALRSLGAEPVVCDVFDLASLREAMLAFHPDIVLDELTDLPDDRARIPELGAANNRMRREGTANLLAAARAAGAHRLIAQSVAWTLPGDGGAAVMDLEGQVLSADGVILRYGQFYGPGTYFGSNPPPPPRIRVDEAARRTLAALDAPPGVITIVEE